MHILTYIHSSIHTNAHTLIHQYTSSPKHTLPYIHTYLYVHSSIHILTYTQRHIFTYTHSHILTHLHILTYTQTHSQTPIQILLRSCNVACVSICLGLHLGLDNPSGCLSLEKADSPCFRSHELPFAAAAVACEPVL